MPQKVVNEAAQGRTARIARRHPVATLGLQMHQEGQNPLGRDVRELEMIHPAAALFCQKLEEKLQGISISTDRVRTGPAGLPKVLLEKRLQQAQQSGCSYFH